MDYFTLFALSPTYSLDLNYLAERYKQLQRQYHPDRFVSATEPQKLQALQQASTINTAYQTLKNPLTRAEYLLELQGLNIGNEQKTVSDIAFLTEQLTLREQLESIEYLSKKEHAAAQIALQDLSKQVETRTQTLTQQLIQELEQTLWQAAAENVSKLRFLEKLQQQIERLEEQLLDL